MGPLTLLLVLILKCCFIQWSIQESCKIQVFPKFTQINSADSVQLDKSKCQQSHDQATYNCSEIYTVPNGLAEWKENGSLIFDFSDSEVINEIKIYYSINNYTKYVLPLISISEPSFEPIRGMVHSSNGLFVASSRGVAVNVPQLTLHIGFNGSGKFNLTSVRFFNCAEVTTSHSSTTLGTPSTGLPLYTLIIIVAVILGFLLLFVACAVLSLTCAIICKRKKRASLPLRIHSLHPNMYETSSSSVSEVKASFGKQDSYSLSTEKPKLPADPEYATLSEWQREMTESPNPFYDSSTSVEMKSRAVEVPQLEWSGSAWDTNIPIASMNQNCSELSRQQSLGQSGHHMTTKSHSMHDMRNSIAINNKSSFQRDGSVTPGPSCSGMMRSYGCHQPMSSSPPPLPLSPPPPLPLSSPTPASPPPPPPPKRKGSVRYPASSAPHVSGGVGAHNLSGSSGNAVSPLVQHNMRAKKHRQSHEVFNSEYEVINGIRNKSNRAMNDY